MKRMPDKLMRSIMPVVLSVAVASGFLGLLTGMATGALKVSDSQALLIMLGSLGTIWGMIMAFWFGGMHDGERKPDLLAPE